MQIEQMEKIERTVLEMIVQALTDYTEYAVTIFREETDFPQDIAEDITREAVESMGLSVFRERLYGKVDFKKAIYAFIPDACPVALMLDAKAEKQGADNSATIQMSQTSMRVKMRRSGNNIDEAGKLDCTIRRGDKSFYVVTIIAKYSYEETKLGALVLKKIRVACIPNGRLQDVYNPNIDDTIWLAGRNAPTLGEDFRVRLSYKKLREKAEWRVRDIPMGNV